MSIKHGTVVTLEVDNEPVINLCGLQPLITDGGFVRDSHLIFTGRTTHELNLFFNHKQRVAYRKRVDTDNDIILQNAISIEQMRRRVIERMWYYGKHYSIGENLDTIDRKKLKRLIKFRMDYIKLTTLGKAANFIITSCPERMKFFDNVTMNLVFVSERVLPKNVVIVGTHSQNVYANPLVVCPIIPREKFNAFCSKHGFDLERIKFDKSKPYPFIDMQVDWYELYQLFLNHVGTDKWYMEEFNDFNTIQDYYSIIHFKER